ncbi:cobalt-precorrin-5B (C(1))-methyltransferase [Shewanella canadensis]|uniref:Cobalt-precorrin-5B C(1)-methyltransferase n=1 Tax=Shewanella canadensis TaxID=271096 RepID=A0A3S0KTQ6_9GAMM|nr:cobalt-precorrin-5B (C(1))-methyltransferase [Shewanella canadensis]RTR37597.1 cobalt-precorrin-5B (C(1))-methyltransferase [Shewanella canadensis]
MTVTKIRRSQHGSELRKGYTTGACATAAALGALTRIFDPASAAEVSILLPIGERAKFGLLHHQAGDVCATAGVIKDAGDDPDCTHGAEIVATVCVSHSPGVRFFAGPGVATITLPGLELGVGEPAINPVPRRMIESHLIPLLCHHGFSGADVTISVPGGEALAKQTIGERLGLKGGISILGTRGTVHPYSTSAYAASVRQGVQVAAKQNLSQMVLTTGSRTEKQAMIIHSGLPQTSFIQAGDFIGVGLRASAKYAMNRVELVVMIGKLCKLACGTMMTHVTGRQVDFERLGGLLTEHCDDPSLLQSIAQARTGRQLLSIVQNQEFRQAFLTDICQQAAIHSFNYAHKKLVVSVRLIDFDGTTLAKVTHGDH